MAEVKVKEEGMLLKFSCGGKELVLDCDKLPSQIKRDLIVFGAKRKVTNAAAGKDEMVALERMQATIDALKDGKWNAKVSAKAAARAQAISMLKSIDKGIRAKVAEQLKAQLLEAGLTEEEIADCVRA